MTALEVVKADLQNHTAILLIKDDPAAKKLLVAWTIYAPRCSDFVIRGTENAKDLIARLWSESLPIDMPTLSAIAGIPQTRAQVIFDRLRAANLIWPDGTIPGNVESLLIGEAGYYVSTLVPKGGSIVADPGMTREEQTFLYRIKKTYVLDLMPDPEQIRADVERLSKILERVNSDLKKAVREKR